jgi:hypothetical protein
LVITYRQKYENSHILIMLYIGANLHLDPLQHFSDEKEFVFVDTLPRSEFDRKGKFSDENYRFTFVDNLIVNCFAKGFHLIDQEELDSNYFTRIMTLAQRIKYFNRVKQTFPYICPNRLTFYNVETGQTLKYYVSTNLEHNMPIPSLENDLQNCDKWIVSGHHPTSCLTDYTFIPSVMYGYSKTSFALDSRDDPSALDSLDNRTKIVMCDYITGAKVECDSLFDLHVRTHISQNP